MSPIKFSFCSSSFDEGAVEAELSVSTLDQVHDILKGKCESQAPTVIKERLSRFMPSTFNQANARRSIEDFVQTSLAVIDVDKAGQEPFENFVLDLANQGVGMVFFESPSSSEALRKYRLIVQLDRQITNPTEFKLVYKKLFDTKIQYDTSCNEVARFFYIPNISKSETFVYYPGDPIKTPQISKKDLEDAEKLSESKISTEDDLSGFFLESPEVVEYKLKFILNWLNEKKLTITKTYPEWLSICFACVSLKNHYLSKDTCFKYFYTFSKLDGDKCADKDAIIKQFEHCWEATQEKITIATIYGKAKQVGCPMPPLNPEIIKMVKGEEKNCYYLALNNNESDDIVTLNKTIDSASVAREKVLLDTAEKFSIKRQEIQTIKEDGTPKFIQSISGFIAKFESQPDRICYILGNNKKGKFFEKSTNSLLIADHYRLPCKAVFHSNIDLWLKQLNRSIDWIYTYLYYSTKMDVALPMIHCWGIKNAGKSTFIKMIGSIWSNPPILNYFTEGSSFKDTAGSSPVIFFDEEVPNRANEIKSMITSNMISVNQKFKSAMYIRGYPRLASAVNEEKFKFPGGSGNSDQGAIYRRVQDIEFTNENRIYLDELGGREVINSWLNGAFREHVKYVQENPEKFNLRKPGKDILILSPEHKDENNTTFNSRHLAIIEYFYGTVCKITKDNEGSKEIYINVKNFFEDLIKNRYISERGSDEDMVAMLRRPFGSDSKLFRRDKDPHGGSRWRLDRNKVVEIQKNLNLHMEELE